MARVNAKQTVAVDAGGGYLEQISKSALIDVIVDAIRREKGDEGYSVSELDAQQYVEPILRMRGDRVPRAIGSK